MSHYLIEKMAKDHHRQLIKEAEMERLILELPKSERQHDLDIYQLAPYALAAIVAVAGAAITLA